MSFSFQNYQSKAVYASISGAFTDQSSRGNFLQFSRVQDMTWSIDYGLTQDMYLNGGTESSYNTYTPINLNMAWFNTNGLNEAAIGLGTVNNPFYTGALNLDQEQNYYVAINNMQGTDEIGAVGTPFIRTCNVGAEANFFNVFSTGSASSNITGVTAGTYVSGSGIPVGTYIVYVFPNPPFGGSVFINNTGLESVTSDLTFFPPANNSVIAMARGVLNSYNLSAQVGSIVQCAAAINCLTAFAFTGIPTNGNQPPSINSSDGTIPTGFSPFIDTPFLISPAQNSGFFNLPPALSQYDPNSPYAQMNVAALGGKDIKLTFPLPSGATNTPSAAFATVFSGDQACYLNSLNLTLTVNRQEVKPLGYIFPTSRAVIWPVEVEMTAEATVSRYQADRLQRIDCTATGVTINLSINQPCTNTPMFGFWSDRMQLASQTFSNSIGARDTVTFSWKGIINNPGSLLFYGDTTNPW